MQGRQSPREHEPVRGGASGSHGDVAAGDGEAGRRAKYPRGEAPEAPAGAGHALEHGALPGYGAALEYGCQSVPWWRVVRSTRELPEASEPIDRLYRRYYLRHEGIELDEHGRVPMQYFCDW